MKNKKAVIVVFALIVVVLVIGIVIAGVKKHKTSDDDDKVKMPTTFTISYSYGGGFTTYANSITRKITVDQDGNVKVELGIDDSLVKPAEYKIDKKDAKELMEYFYDNEFYELKKDLSEDDVTDMYSSYLEVKSDAFNRKVGGYAASLNKKFRKFESKFEEIVLNKEVMEKFNKDVIDAYEKSDY